MMVKKKKDILIEKEAEKIAKAILQVVKAIEEGADGAIMKCEDYDIHIMKYDKNSLKEEN